jgi:hypothetical protein
MRILLSAILVVAFASQAIASDGIVSIGTQPVGAEVLIDDTLRGISPITLTMAPGGTR